MDKMTNVLLEKFSAMPPPKDIKNDYEYVDYALSVLQETKIAGKIFPNLLKQTPSAEVKSNKISESVRIQGNELLLKTGAVLDVLILYTKSIAYAETGSEQLALAYGNRSAFFFYQKMFKECLEDIERALQNNFPKEKVDKLIRRRSQATELLCTQKHTPLYGEVPKIKKKNLHLPGASNGIKIEKNEEYGRHIVANREINAGEILLVEKPDVHYLCYGTYDFLLHCSECLELCYNVIPCEKCIGALYCSTVCRQKAFVNYHRYECAVLRYFDIDSDNINRIAIKMTLKVAKEHGTMHPEEDYKKFPNLFNVDFIVQISTAAKVFFVLKYDTDFFTEFDINENVVKEMLLHNWNICVINCLGISKWHVDGLITIGAGLYPTLSLLNHSCYENVMPVFYGNTVAVKAKKRIKQGEQCFLNYGVDVLQTKTERQQRLITQYQFICKCQACLQNWPITETIAYPVKLLFTELVQIYQDCTNTEIEMDHQRKYILLQKTFRIAQMLENEAPCSVHTLTTIIFRRLLFDGNSTAEQR